MFFEQPISDADQLMNERNKRVFLHKYIGVMQDLERCLSTIFLVNASLPGDPGRFPTLILLSRKFSSLRCFCYSTKNRFLLRKYGCKIEGHTLVLLSTFRAQASRVYGNHMDTQTIRYYTGLRNPCFCEEFKQIQYMQIFVFFSSQYNGHVIA